MRASRISPVNHRTHQPLLPPLGRGETYQSYLQRIDIGTALLAEMVQTSQKHVLMPPYPV